MQSAEFLRQVAKLDRDSLEQVMRDLADSRADGDLEKIGKVLTEDVRMELACAQPTFPYFGKFHGREAVLSALGRMRLDIEYQNYETLALLVDHDCGFMRRRALLRHRGTNRSGYVEIWDHFRFRDGLVSELVYFPDFPALMALSR